MFVMRSSSSFVSPKAWMLIGTDCRFSDCFCAVTTTSSSITLCGASWA